MAKDNVPTGAVMLERELRSRVRRRVSNGHLPVTLVTLINGGYGSGHKCVVCDKRVKRDEAEHDVLDPRDGSHLIFHFACYVVWQRECARRIRTGESPKLLQPGPLRGGG